MGGIAAARVVIADTDPFNPVLENRLQGAEGPHSAGITNRLPLEHILLWEVEWRHQGQYRRDGAANCVQTFRKALAPEEIPLNRILLGGPRRSQAAQKKEILLGDQTAADLAGHIAGDLDRVDRPIGRCELVRCLNGSSPLQPT